MNLDKTKARLDKLRNQDREDRKNGMFILTEPGPWHSIQIDYQFNPSFFRGLIAANPPADKTVIGDYLLNL